MNRRVLVVLAVALLLSGAGYGLWRSHVKTYCQLRGNCPNVVFIILDDMSWDHFGFLAPGLTITPSIDKLAAQGFVFDNGYNSNSRCRASLATLLTGQYPHQNQIYANHGVLEMRDKKALPLLLEQAGYKTFAGGKFWEGDPALMKFTASDVDTFHFVRKSQDKLEHFMDRYANKAPLFIWWAPMLPHLPHDAVDTYRDKIVLDAIPLPFPMRETEAQDYRNNEKAFRATILWVDTELGNFMQKLEQHHLRDNTWIVLLADNGWDVAQVSKGSPYDIGVRTPIIVIGPGVQQGNTQELVSTRNIYGSVLGMVGLVPDVDRAADSDLLLLAQQASPDKKAVTSAVKNATPVFWASYPGYTAKSEPMPRAERDVFALSLRSQQWQYTFYTKSFKQSDADEEKAPVIIHTGMQQAPEFMAGDEELFDLDKDSYGAHNLASDPHYAAALEDYRRQTLQWWQGSGGKPIDVLKDCVSIANHKQDNKKQESVLCKKALAVSGPAH